MENETSIGGSENLEAMREAVNYNAFLVDHVERRMRDCANVLDFGAGNGLFAESLRGHGHSVTCIEPEPALAARLSQLGFTAHESLADVAPASIDGIYTLNVLEHIDDDVAALRSLHDKLKPGGQFYIYVPAFMILYSSMDKRVGHVRRYRLGELQRKCVAAGFAVESAGYADSLGFFASLAFRMVDSGTGDLNPGTVRLYDRYIFPLSRALDALASGFLGKNVWIHARRPREDG